MTKVELIAHIERLREKVDALETRGNYRELLAESQKLTVAITEYAVAKKQAELNAHLAALRETFNKLA